MALPDVCKIKAATERQKKVPGLGVTAAIYPENANPDEDKALTKTVPDFSGSPYPKGTVLEARIGPEDVRIEVVGAQYLTLNPDSSVGMGNQRSRVRALLQEHLLLGTADPDASFFKHIETHWCSRQLCSVRSSSKTTRPVSASA